MLATSKGSMRRFWMVLAIYMLRLLASPLQVLGLHPCRLALPCFHEVSCTDVVLFVLWGWVKSENHGFYMFLYVFIIWMWWRTSNRYHSPAVLFPVQGAGVLIHPQFDLCRKMMRACHSTLQRWQRPLFWLWWDWIQLCHSKRVRLNQKIYCDPLIVWRKRDREREREL